jgi:hypothetical protein
MTLILITGLVAGRRRTGGEAGQKPRAAFHSEDKTKDAVTIDFGRPERLPPALANIETAFG